MNINVNKYGSQYCVDGKTEILFEEKKERLLRRKKDQQGSRRGNVTLDELSMSKWSEVITVSFAWTTKNIETLPSMECHSITGTLSPSNLSLVHNFNTPGSMSLFHWTVQCILVVHIQEISIYLLDSTIQWINHYTMDNPIAFGSAYPIGSGFSAKANISWMALSIG